MARLQALGQAILTTSTQMQQLLAVATSTTEKLAEVREAVERDAPAITSRLDQLNDEAGGRLEDLKQKLALMVAEGDTIATSILEVIQKVEEGAVTADKAITAFGDGVTNIDGRVRSIKDLLLDLLPTTGQVQDRIREFASDATPTEALLKRLEQGSNAAAQQFANLFRMLQQGTGSLDRLIQEAQRIRQAIPGSEQSQVIEELIDRLNEGGAG